MSDNELLLAISDMMDKKFETNLRPIKSDISSLKSDVTILKEDVSGLKSDVAILKEDVSGLKSDVAILKEDMENVKGEISELKNHVTRINLNLENNVNPRLQNIELCYTDTYNRYKDNSDRMEAALDDIGLLKKVVMEHSTKLKNVG